MTTSRKYSAFAVFILLTYAVILSLFFLSWNFDDGYIVYRVVDNLLHGHGWRYNITENVNASTSVLNTVLITAISFFTNDIPLSAHIIGGISLFAAGLFCFLILSRSAPFIIAFLISLFLERFLAMNSTWGVESNLFIALLLGIPWLEIKGKNSWYLIGLLILTRPDGIIVAGLKCLHEFYLRKRIPLRGLLLVALILCPWIIFSFVQFGSAFPNTLSAKVWQGRSGLWGNGWIYLKAFVSSVTQAGWEWWVITGFGTLGAASVVLKRRPLAYLVLFAGIQQLAYVFLNVPGYHWYFAVWNSMVIVSAFFGAALFVPRFPKFLSHPYLSAFVLSSCFCDVCFQIPAAVFGSITDARDDSYQKILSDLLAKTDQRESSDTDVGLLEVGTIGYFTRNHILDLSGLTSRNPEFITGKNTDQFFSNPPAFLILHHSPAWHFERAISDDMRFQMIYRQVARTEDVAVPVELYERIGDRGPVPESEIRKFVEQNMPAAKNVGKLGEISVNPEAACLPDQLNGSLIRVGESGELTEKVMKLRGWAAIKNPDFSCESELKVYLVSRENDFYEVQTRKTERSDVRAAVQGVGCSNVGFEAEGSTFDLKGEFQVFVKLGNEWCGSMITVKNK